MSEKIWKDIFKKIKQTVSVAKKRKMRRAKKSCHTWVPICGQFRAWWHFEALHPSVPWQGDMEGQRQYHLYLAYPSNNTKQQGGGLQQHFPPLDKQPGWPSPQARANPHSNKGTTPTPHLGGKQIIFRCAPTPPPPDSNPGRAGGKIHKTGKLAAACSQGRLPPQPPSRQQLARLPITGNR